MHAVALSQDEQVKSLMLAEWPSARKAERQYAYHLLQQLSEKESPGHRLLSLSCTTIEGH